MRFANVPVLKPEDRAPAAGFLRRMIGLPASQAPLGPGAAVGGRLERKAEDLPRDLDQRVRLVGEW